MTKINFRKEALQQLGSPDRFDEAMGVVTPKMWFALLGVLLLVAFSITWAFLGRIPEKVDAVGIFYLSGRISEITSEKPGILRDIFVREGQAVAKGQLLAAIEIQQQCDLNSQSVPQLEIRAPEAGIVMSIAAYPISRIKEGDTIFLLFPLGIAKRDLVGLAFVSAQDGKKIKKDMKTEIEVSSARVELYGKMLGKVSKVSELPVSKEEILSFVKNSQFANAIQNRFKITPFFVRLKPDLEKNSATGYRWTLKQPAQQIDSGTIFEAKITIIERRPIDYVIPLFERML